MPTHNALPLEHYRDLATEYIEITKKEGFRGVVTKMGQRRGMDPKTISTRIKRARQLGLIEPYGTRFCTHCRQPVARKGIEISVLSSQAEQGADLARRLATLAEHDGQHKASGSLWSAVAHLNAAVQDVALAYDLAVAQGAILPAR